MAGLLGHTNLWHCRQCRHGTSALTITGPAALANGVNLELLIFDVFHAESIVFGLPADDAGAAGEKQCPDLVGGSSNPDRQSHPQLVGCRGTERGLSPVSRRVQWLATSGRTGLVPGGEHYDCG